MKHEISGKVIHGEKYGRKIGFPTANLDRPVIRAGSKILNSAFMQDINLKIQNSKFKLSLRDSNWPLISIIYQKLKRTLLALKEIYMVYT